MTANKLWLFFMIPLIFYIIVAIRLHNLCDQHILEMSKLTQDSEFSSELPKQELEEAGAMEQLLSRVGVAESWQTVKDHQLYIYSAYHDPRLNSVTVIGIVEVGKINKSTVCVMWNKQDPDQPEFVPATITRLPEDHEQRYSVAFISCTTNHTADFVSLHMGSSTDFPVDSLTNILQVTTINVSKRRKHRFTVCLGPLHHSIHPQRFVEIIELNRLFGADHFIIHNSLADSTSIQPYLDYYAKRGVISILSWQLPEIDNALHYLGQMAVVNNCLYRNMYVSKYLVLTDLDEIIVPMKANNWIKLLETFKNDTDKIGGYDFISVFIKTRDQANNKYANDAFVQKYDVLSLLKTTRKVSMLPHKRRSKMILLPERVRVAGIHYVHNYISKEIHTFDVPSADGVMFHYKDKNPFRNSADMLEDRMHSFASEIIHRLKTVYEAVNKGL